MTKSIWAEKFAALDLNPREKQEVASVLLAVPQLNTLDTADLYKQEDRLVKLQKEWVPTLPEEYGVPFDKQITVLIGEIHRMVDMRWRNGLKAEALRYMPKPPF